MKCVFVYILLLCLGFAACKKSDSVSTHTIKGQVYNLCTDSGIANITVYLKENGNNIAQMQSGTNGNFSFGNVQIHSSDEYVYELYIPTVDYLVSVYGIDGDDEQIIKTGIDNPFILRIVPYFQNLYYYLPFQADTDTDTFTVSIKQNIFHKNIPSRNYSFFLSYTPPIPPPPAGYTANELGLISDYPMGWWQQTTDRVKNGVHIIKTDSIYIAWGANMRDTIPW